MNGDDGVGSVVLAAEHLLGFRRVDLLFEHVQRLLQICRDVFAALGPLEEHADVVDFPGDAVAQLEILREAPLALQRLLRFGLVIPEIRRCDFLFELR